jgi:hypothetical protein
MRKRTPEESAAYFREYRARKKASAGAPATPLPKKGATPATPPSPISCVCPNCEAQAAEIAHLGDLVRTLLAKVATLEGDITGSSTTAHQVTPKGAAADALRQPMITEKTNRINTFGRNPSIGVARI